ncbi:hypothetical protein P24_18174 [Oceanibaculum indicum P24]|uniref:Uncharacterized protein n=1 Tax=Oceanibaculum indicum P24 TaxID=1207063 RepID=K2IYB7_9PROT|nr:hypothetical protein P24_18174 [Oceanibaculum indicum P24]
MRDAIHGVRHPEPMPVDGGLFGEAILDSDTEAFALSHADLLPRDGSVIAPGWRLAVRLRYESHQPWRGLQ